MRKALARLFADGTFDIFVYFLWYFVYFFGPTAFICLSLMGHYAIHNS